MLESSCVHDKFVITASIVLRCVMEHRRSGMGWDNGRSTVTVAKLETPRINRFMPSCRALAGLMHDASM